MEQVTLTLNKERELGQPDVMKTEMRGDEGGKKGAHLSSLSRYKHHFLTHVFRSEQNRYFRSSFWWTFKQTERVSTKHVRRKLIPAVCAHSLYTLEDKAKNLRLPQSTYMRMSKYYLRNMRKWNSRNKFIKLLYLTQQQSCYSTTRNKLTL